VGRAPQAAGPAAGVAQGVASHVSLLADRPTGPYFYKDRWDLALSREFEVDFQKSPTIQDVFTQNGYMSIWH
jgi:hypothetical protein